VGRATLYSSPYNRADNRLSQSPHEPYVETCDVELTTLDEVLAGRGLFGIDAMKVDGQGNELHVIRGAQRTISAGLRWI
jgi:FkbM family methyltransferase